VESVAYLGSIGEVVYAFFLLLGILIFLSGIDSRRQTIHGGFLAGMLAFTFIGLFAKETAVVALPIVAVYSLLFVKPKWTTQLKLLSGSCVVIASYLFIRFFLAQIPLQATHLAPISQASMSDRLLTVPFEIISYFKILLFPRDLSVARHFVVSSAGDVRFLASLLVLVIVGLVAVRYCLKPNGRVPVFFSLWFIIALMPALNLVPLDMTIAERWLYVPMIGFVSALSIIIVRVVMRLLPQYRIAAYGAILVVLVALSARTVLRNANWKDGLTLYQHDMQIVDRTSPQGSYDLENNYGVGLFRAGQISEAAAHFRRSIEIQPKWTFSHNNLGAALERQGDLSGALEEYRRSIDTDDYYLAYENLGTLLIKLQRFDEAREFLTAALKKLPRNNKLKLQLAVVYAVKPASKQMGLELVSGVLSEDPSNTQARQLLMMLRDQP
jgi:hypothetical protein